MEEIKIMKAKNKITFSQMLQEVFFVEVLDDLFCLPNLHILIKPFDRKAWGNKSFYYSIQEKIQ